MSSNPSSSRRAPRGGGGRGRGRGGGGRRSGRGRSKRSDRGGNGGGNSTPSVNSGATQHNVSMPGMRDEEILIAFMPYLKGDNQEAMFIHETYQSSNDQQSFLRSARDFLSRELRQEQGTQPAKPVHRASDTVQDKSPMRGATSANTALSISPQREDQFAKQMATGATNTSSNLPPFLRMNPQPEVSLQQGRSSPVMESLERKMAILLSDDDDPVVTMPMSFQSNPVSAIGSNVGSSPARPEGSLLFSSQRHGPSSQIINGHQQQQLPFHIQAQSKAKHQPITPPRNSGMPMPGPGAPASTFSSLFPPSGASGNGVHSQVMSPPQSQAFNVQPQLPAATWGSAPPGIRTPPATQGQPSSQSPLEPRNPNPTVSDNGDNDKQPQSNGPPKSTKKEYQPKRLWTHLEEQPGKILANNVTASIGTVLDLRPRQELTAQWMLPLSYLRGQAAGREDVKSLRQLLGHLAVGLFRRGCTENGAQASIVSKEVLTPKGENRSDYPFQVVNDTVVGTVPFYSPRTPGHVVFRLYWQNEPLNTLATGPTLNVRVTEADFESSIRFILSNFKAKKVNPTSLSSLNSFALVLEQFQLSQNSSQQGLPRQLEGAGRAVWGCICEARKVLEACASEYTKTTSKLAKLEETVEELKALVEEEEKDQEKSEAQSTDSTDSYSQEPTPNVRALKEKQKALMSGRASCERKWRDSQLSFASILKAVVTNPSMSMLLRRELISKLRVEYELWCPLSEEFAVPGDSDAKMWYDPLSKLPHSITAEHFRLCAEARSKMQVRTLGFDPNTNRLEGILYPNRGRGRQMNPAAVNVFNQLSGAMGQLYQDNYTTANKIHEQREMIRLQLEKFVNMSDGFPPGTKVAVFGSSANGFGSPKSDLDMCLQIPHGALPTKEDDPTGSDAMASLARIFEENGMKDVDTSRLTARIPVIKFNYPTPGEDNGNSDAENFMECDLSMHNPLAVLNTALLRTYAEINPVPRVLAAVIKRWAKARDINNPARHTLSSYGYILMLLHFLTFHQRSGNGLVSPVTRNDGKSSRSQVLPLLPNLQWMDDRWPEQPPGSSYRELPSLPKDMMKHPLEEKAVVNTYFYRPVGHLLGNLQRLFPGQDLSIGILLASFFRYYAYEFDYKRHVVSLHSTVSHGLVEREVKAELDGWRNYSAALTIEDPFETFYDVAHVLRGGYYHRIRREFAVAYSKIADVASGKNNSSWNSKHPDITKLSGTELVDWICEPVASDSKEEIPSKSD